MKSTSSQPQATAAKKAVTSNLISASAGTGKTYQLASRFVALLALGYKAEEMIALTFTRKAAGEFRNRILKALSEGALDLDESGKPRKIGEDGKLEGRNGITARVWETWSGLTIIDGKAAKAGNDVALCPDSACVVEMAAKANKTPEELYAEDDALYKRLGLPRLTDATYRQLLADVVKVMSRLTLSTLDSFFNRIVRGNSLTIGIRKLVPLEPADVTNERNTVLREILSQAAVASEEGRYFLQQYENLTCNEGKHMTNFLQEQIEQHLTLYRSIESIEAWGNAEAFALEDSGEESSITQEQWADYDTELNRLCEQLKQRGSNLADKAKAAATALLKDLKECSFSFLHKHVYPDKRNSGSKFNKFYEAPKSTDDEKQLANYMGNIITHAKKHYLHALINKTKGLFYILNRFATNYLKHMRKTGKVGFDDIATFAYNLMQGDKEKRDERRAYVASRIAYNMDTTYKHWMLDEFQDTAETQFSTLEPVLTEIAQCERHPETKAAERSIFVVGDEKQSIYGFRTGDTEVFQTLQNKSPWKEVLKPSVLEKSYRSSPVIMGEHGFINNMFLALNEVEHDIIIQDNNELDFAAPEEKLTPNDRLKQFTGHRSATGKAGYVRISAVQYEENSEDNRNAFYNSIAHLLQSELTNEAGTPRNGMSIAILTRNNKEAEELEEKLVEKLPSLPVLRIGDDKIAANSQLGELLLSFFLWLRYPDDAYRAALVKTSPMRAMLAETAASINARNDWEKEQQLLRKAHEVYAQQLETHGYTSLVRKLLECFPTEPKNLRTGKTAQLWLTEAHAFDCVGGSLSEWISHIGKASCAAAGSARYVQIMTMHKSKGLEFDAVILPYISSDAEDELSDLAHFSRKDDNGNVEALLLSPGGKEKRDAWKDIFDPLCAAKKQQLRKEAYNLLYVAATRAKHANYIFCNGASLVDAKKKEEWKGVARSTSGLIRRMLSKPAFVKDSEPTEHFEQFQEETKLWDDGDATWYNNKDFIKERLPQEITTAPTLPPIQHHRRKRVSPSTMAAAEDKQQKEAEDKPARTAAYGGATDGAEFGTKVHEYWEQITWLGESKPAWLEQPLTDEQKTVAAALHQPEVAALFTRSKVQVQEVYNEQSVEAINDKDEWISASIDRLVLTYDDAGQVIAAHIIDFKTNKISPHEGFATFEDWLMDHYTGQMREYRKLISSAFNLPAQAITVSLISCPREGEAKVLTYTEAQLPVKLDA